MSAVKTDQSEGIPGAGIPEQAVKKCLQAPPPCLSQAPSLFFALFFSIHAFPTLGAWNRLAYCLYWLTG